MEERRKQMSVARKASALHQLEERFQTPCSGSLMGEKLSGRFLSPSSPINSKGAMDSEADGQNQDSRAELRLQPECVFSTFNHLNPLKPRVKGLSVSN